MARQRAVSVKEYLLWKYSYLSQARILIYSRGEDWTGLRQSVELDNDIPNRTEVLQILNEVPDTERCKVLLQHLNPIEKGFGYDLRIGLIATIKLSAQPLTYIVFQCEERSLWKQPLLFQFFCNIVIAPTPPPINILSLAFCFSCASTVATFAPAKRRDNIKNLYFIFFFSG